MPHDNSSVGDVEQLLDKNRIQKQLLNASLFLLAYELLLNSVVEGVKDFFLCGFEEGEFRYSQEYNSKVLARAKHVFEASLIFLTDIDAISKEDMVQIQDLRNYRNDVAHNIPHAVFDLKNRIDNSKIEMAGHFLHKIDNFWGRMEADTNPDFDNKDIDYEGITSIRSEVYKYIAKIVNS